MPETKYRRLEDLSVLFVSGVKRPATGKSFVLVKEAKWEGFVNELRAKQPDVAARLDALVEKGDYTALHREIATLDKSIGQPLADALREMDPEPDPTWEQYEPTAKDLAGLSRADVNAILLYKRLWTSDMRQKHKDQGGAFAGPGDSYPIANCEDVDAAYRAAGRAKGSPGAIQKNVVKIARQKKLTHCLPQAVQERLKKGESAVADELEAAEKARKKKAEEESDDALTDEEEAALTDDNAEEKPKKKKAAKADDSHPGGVMGAIATMVARGAGYDVVPRGTADLIMKAASLLAGKPYEQTWPQPHPGDDVPAGERIGMLPDQMAFPGRAPNDQTPWKEPIDRVQKNMGQQPDVRMGQPYPSSVNLNTVDEGEPATDDDQDEPIVEGEPVTKSDMEDLAETLTDLVELLEKKFDEYDARLDRIEAVKGLSRIARYTDDDEDEPSPAQVARKSGDSLWKGSPFDVPV